MSVIKALLAKFVNVLGIRSIDMSLGFVFGLFRGYLIVSFIIFCINITNFKYNQNLKNSFLIPFFDHGVSFISEYFEDIKNSFGRVLNIDEEVG